MKFRKIVSIVLALALTTIFFSGCGDKKNNVKTYEDKPEEQVKLRWVISASEQADYSKVLAEVNKLLPTLLPNTQLELVLDPSEAQKWDLWMASGESFDIAWVGGEIGFQSEVDKRAYLSLNTLIDQYAPTIKAEESIFDVNYNSAKYKDNLYAIPNNQYHIKETLYLKIPQALKKYIDVNAIVSAAEASTTTTEAMYLELDKYFAKVKAANVADTSTVAPYCDIESLYSIATRGYDMVADGTSLCYKAFADGSVKLIDFHDTDEFKMFMKYSAEWYSKGYISPDVVTGGSVGNRYFTAITSTNNNIELDPASNTKVTYDTIIGDYAVNIPITTGSQNFLGISKMGSALSYNAIPSTATHPARAMKLLELLRTTEGAPLLNMIIYGLEGQHYTKLSDKQIRPVDYVGQGTSTSKYGIANWQVGTLFNAYMVEYYSLNLFDYANNYYSVTQKSYFKTPVFGYTFDNTNVENDLAQVTSAIREFETILICGTAENYESTYNSMMSKVSTAGMAKVISEYQSQIDAFVKK